ALSTTRRYRYLTRGDSSEWAQLTLLQGSLTIVGWISRKHLASGRGRTFFLTSLLIELIERWGCYSSRTILRQSSQRLSSNRWPRSGTEPHTRQTHPSARQRLAHASS